MYFMMKVKQTLEVKCVHNVTQQTTVRHFPYLILHPFSGIHSEANEILPQSLFNCKKIVVLKFLINTGTFMFSNILGLIT